MITITKATECMICKRIIFNEDMVLINNGFICENCCMEIAMAKIVKIEANVFYNPLGKK